MNPRKVPQDLTIDWIFSDKILVMPPEDEEDEVPQPPWDDFIVRAMKLHNFQANRVANAL